MSLLASVAMIVVGIAVAIVGASVLPWIPVLNTIAPVAALLSFLAPLPFRAWGTPVLALTAAAVGSAALHGAAMLPYAATMLAAWALLRTQRQTFRYGAPAVALGIVAVVAATAERVVVSFLTGPMAIGPPAAGTVVVLTATFAAALWNMAFGFIALRIGRRAPV